MGQSWYLGVFNNDRLATSTCPKTLSRASQSFSRMDAKMAKSGKNPRVGRNRASSRVQRGENESFL